MTAAYLLVAHGSRDPRPQVALDRLAGMVRERFRTAEELRVLTRPWRSPFLLPNGSSWVPSPYQSTEPQPGPIVIGTAVLECAPFPLHTQIEQFAASIPATVMTTLHIVPLFLLPGVHVMEDIPEEVTIAQHHLKQAGQFVPITITPYLGTHRGLVNVLQKQSHSRATGRVLLSHGSRRSGSQEVVEAIADQLGAVAAYWSTPPSLETQVEQLVYAGHTDITLQPYFLFAGGITDAIAQRVDQLSHQFRTVTLQLLESLGPTPELAKLVIDLMASDRVFPSVSSS